MSDAVFTPASNREPWMWFFTKAFVILGLLYMAGHFAAKRWRVGVDPQANVSVHTADGGSPRLVLVDRYDLDLKRGDLVAFEMNTQARQMVAAAGVGIPAEHLNKRVAGLPGDQIVVDEQGVFINGIQAAEGLALATTLAQDPAAFTRHFTVPKGHYFMLGDVPASFDSRYWGAVDQSELIGKTTVIYAE